LQEFNKKRGR